MNLKTWLLAGLGFMPMKGSAQESGTNTPNNLKNKIETVADTATTDSARHKAKTIKFKPVAKDVTASEETLTADTLNEKDTFIPVDSAAVAWGNLSAREKVLSCSEQILLFITQFHDIKAQFFHQFNGVECHDAIIFFFAVW